MGVSIKQGTFSSPGSVTTQDITDVGFQPKAVIIWTPLQTGNGYSIHLFFGYGFSDGTNNASIAFTSQDAQAASNTWSNANNNAVCQIISTGGADFERVSITTMLVNGFRLSWAVSPSSHHYHYLAIGGTDITNVKVGTQSVGTTTTGNKSYTGVGFQPDFLITAATGFLPTASAYTFNNTPEAHGGILIGCSKSTTSRFALGMVSEDNRATMDTHRIQRNDKCFIYLDNTTGTTLLDADFVSFDSDGWTWNYTTNTTANNQNAVFTYLAFKGGVWDVGEHDEPTTNSTTTINTTVGSGNTLKGAMLYSVMGPPDTSTLQTEGKIVLGAGDSSNNQGCIGLHDIDNVADSAIAAQHSDTVIQYYHTANANHSLSTAQGIATATFSTNSIGLAWTSTDGTARELMYWALSEIAVEEISYQSYGNIFQQFDSNKNAIFG